MGAAFNHPLIALPVAMQNGTKPTRLGFAEVLTPNVVLTALKVADDVIPEPLGGAHRSPREAAERVGEALRRHLSQLLPLSAEQLIEQRYQKFRAAGAFLER